MSGITIWHFRNVIHHSFKYPKQIAEQGEKIISLNAEIANDKAEIADLKAKLAEFQAQSQK